MGVVSVNRINAGRAVETEDAIELTEEWQVITDDGLTDTSETARLATGIPRRGQAQAENTGLLAKSIESVQDSEARTRFVVTVRYDSKTKPLDQQQDPENPLEAVPEVSGGSVIYQEPVYTNRAGQVITTTAYQPLDPAMMREYADHMIRIQRNEAYLSLAVYTQYATAVNSDDFAGFTAEQARILNINWSRVYSAAIGGYYYPVTYEIGFREDGWYGRAINQGTMYLDDDGNQKPVQIKDARGRDVNINQPVLLDAAGHVLPPGAQGILTQEEIYPALPFSIFNFPPVETV